MNLVYSCCTSGRRFGSQLCCLGFANRDDSLCERVSDTFLISFEKQTQVYILGYGLGF